MSTITFDTLKFVRSLEASGIPVNQAEAISSAVRDAHDSANLATKSDIERLDMKIETKFNLLQWMLGAVLALALANFAKQYF
jgi:hypothetical protein